MELKKGYKQTEVGIIPENWKILKLGDIGKTFGGLSGKSKDDFKDGVFPYIPFMNIMINPIIDSNYFDYVNLKYGESQNSALKGDLFFNGSSETPEEVGMCSVLLEDIPTLYLNSFCFGFRLQKDLDIDGLYLSYYFRSKEGRKLFFSMAQGATRYNLSKANFNRISIPIPPLPEQTAIAEALSDMDALIAKTEKLIEKKKAIKQGMMQELFTPKEGWVTKKLGEVCDIKKGQLITEFTRVDGLIPVIAGGKTPAYFHNKPNRTGKTITISGSGASAGYVSFHNYPIFASDCSTISESTFYNIYFIFYWLQMHQYKIYKMQTGGAQPHIHPSDLSPMLISLPSVKEQSIIGQKITDIDLSISSSENKLQKIKRLKQGMMQALLTGKIRLI